ncbi:MAG: hypothetical protein WCX74_03460 [Candidatus Paceibacterota bacterium]
MVTKELLDYINYQLDHGESWEATKRDLAASGWGASTLDEAFSQIMAVKREAAMAKAPSAMIEPAAKNGAIAPMSDQPKIGTVPPQGSIQTSQKVSLDLKKEPQAISGINVPGLPQKNIQPEKKGKLGVAIAVVIILLLFLAGGTFAYFNYFNSESVVAKVFQNSQKTSSGNFSGNIKFQYYPSEALLKKEINLDKQIGGFFDFDGSYNFKNTSNAKMNVKLRLNSANENNENYKLDSEARIIDNDIYLKVNDIILPPQYEQYISAYRSSITSKWLKFGLTNQGPEENISYILNKAKAENDKISSKLAKALKLEFKGFEGCNGSLCGKYDVVIDKNGLKDYLTEFAKENGASDEDIVSGKEDIDKFVDQITSNINIEILLGYSDFLIHKAKITLNSETDEGKIVFEGTFTSSEENSDIEISSAEDPVNIEDIAYQIMNSNADKTKDDEIKEFFYQNQVKYTAENYKSIKGTYIGFDKPEGSQNPVIAIVNNIGGDPAIIYASKDKYCLSKPLAESSGSYCSDSTNYIGGGTCDKEKIQCNKDFSESSSMPTNPTEQPSQEETPAVNTEKTEVESLIDSLAAALQKHNTEKSTYLGYISSQEGIKAVKKINEFEGEALVVATSKAKFCIMKKSGETVYCTDSANYSGSSDKCSSKNISCE